MRFVGISKEKFDKLGHQSTEYNGCEADHDQSRTLDDRYLIPVFICALNGQDQGEGNRSSYGSCNGDDPKLICRNSPFLLEVQPEQSRKAEDRHQTSNDADQQLQPYEA